jgi:hypothetical protein
MDMDMVNCMMEINNNITNIHDQFNSNMHYNLIVNHESLYE